MRRSCSSDFAANAASMLAVFALMVAVASAIPLVIGQCVTPWGS